VPNKPESTGKSKMSYATRVDLAYKEVMLLPYEEREKIFVTLNHYSLGPDVLDSWNKRKEFSNLFGNVVFCQTSASVSQ